MSAGVVSCSCQHILKYFPRSVGHVQAVFQGRVETQRGRNIGRREIVAVEGAWHLAPYLFVSVFMSVDICLDINSFCRRPRLNRFQALFRRARDYMRLGQWEYAIKVRTRGRGCSGALDRSSRRLSTRIFVQLSDIVFIKVALPCLGLFVESSRKCPDLGRASHM